MKRTHHCNELRPSHAGQTVTLVATVFPAGTQGSVGFTVNGAPISASIPLNAQGQASFPWTPPMAISGWFLPRTW